MNSGVNSLHNLASQFFLTEEFRFSSDYGKRRSLTFSNDETNISILATQATLCLVKEKTTSHHHMVLLKCLARSASSQLN